MSLLHLRLIRLSALCCLLSGSALQAATITYGPVVAPVDPPGGSPPTSARVFWRTDTPTTSNTAYAGAGPSGPWTVTATDNAVDTRHEVLINGLAAGATFYVYVTSDAASSAPVKSRMAANLLVNGSLETWHAVSGQGWGSQEPDGWHGWEIYPWNPPGSNNPDHIAIQMDRPTAIPSPAVKDGAHRAGMDEGWRSCYGGMYQTVSGLAPGDYQISAWVAWQFSGTSAHDRHLLEIVAKDGAHQPGIAPTGEVIFRQFSPGEEKKWQLISGTVHCSSGTVTLYANLRSDNYDGSSFAHFDALRMMALSEPAVSFSNFASSRVINGAAYDVTITYQTSIPVTTQIDWGPSASYGSSSAQNPALATNHQVTLSGVPPSSTPYHYRAHATAPGDVDEFSADQTFDASALTFSGVSSAVEPQTGKICTVSWTTNYPTADNRLYYRALGSGEYTEVVEPAAPASTAHAVTVTGLSLAKTYQFYVTGASSDILPAQSALYSFQTPTSPALANLYIGMAMIGGPLSKGGDDVGPAQPVQNLILRDASMLNIDKLPSYNWPTVQPNDPGVGPNVYDWSKGDEKADDLIPGKARTTYFQMYGSTPSWLTQDTARFWQKFEEFVEAMAVHLNTTYGDADYIFENEPNISRAPSGWSWDNWYIHCLQHFYVAVHRADAKTGRTNRVVAGNLSGQAASGFASLYAKGLKNYSDVLGYHPYAADLRTGLEVSDLALIHSIQTQYGDGAKKIYVTEGWGSGRAAGFDRSSPTVPVSAQEVENMWLSLVNGWDNAMTPRQNWSPEYLYGMRFFCGNDNWGAGNWRKRAIPQKDGAGNIIGFIVDGYWMTPDIAPQFWNGGLLDWYGNSKDALMLVFPGNGLVFMNPGFELASDPPEANLPHFWTTASDPAPPQNYSLDSTVYHGGRNSLRLTAPASVWQKTAKRSVLPGVSYRARVWCRLEAQSSGAPAFYLRFADLSGSQKSTPVYADPIAADGQWRLMQATAVAPAFASVAEAGCSVSGAGSAWFDDVTISMTDSAEVGMVRGYTLDEEQNPVAGCIVRTTTGGFQTISDANGYYELPAVDSGTYDFTCRKEGYVPSRISNQTVASERLTFVSFHMGLVKPGLSVTGVSSSQPSLPDAQGQTSVEVTVANSKPYPVMVAEVGCFVDSAGQDSTGDFAIEASPSNPTTIPASGQASFHFTLKPLESAVGRSFTINAYAFGQEDRPNMLSNGNFDAADPFQNWGFYSESSTCQWLADTGVFVSAPRALKNIAADASSSKFNWAGNSSAYGPSAVAAKPNTNYIVGAYHKDNTTGLVDLNLFIEEYFYNGSSWLYNGRHFSAVPHRTVWANDYMVYRTGDPAVTAGLYSTNRLRISVGSFIRSNGASTTAWWDDVYLKEEGDWLADDRADQGAALSVPRALSSVSQVRDAAQGELVTLGGLVVSAGDGVFPDRIYAEQTDRAAGVAIVRTTGDSAADGASIVVMGTVARLDGEPALINAEVSLGGNPGVPEALAMNGSAVTGGALTTLGLLVSFTGRVSYAAPDGSWFTVDDGSGAQSSGQSGINVITTAGAGAQAEGSFLTVIGISGCEDDGAQAVIRPRTPGDVILQ
ncbi:MAG: carboxypeptidase regulatory-like domain-containing protein [Armatimonadetes bacterium]|nr:carboxypeptidase regulatory-like domain-containing protein [Armatimonadota bacterium]